MLVAMGITISCWHCWHNRLLLSPSSQNIKATIDVISLPRNERFSFPTPSLPIPLPLPLLLPPPPPHVPFDYLPYIKGSHIVLRKMGWLLKRESNKRDLHDFSWWPFCFL